MLKKTALILAALALSVGSMSAATIVATVGDSWTFDQLVGNDLKIGDKIFTNFVYFSGGGVEINEVTVRPLFDQSVGISFQGAWQAPGGQSNDAAIAFLVKQEQDLATIIGSSLGIVGSAGDTGYITVIEDQCAGGFLIACAGGESAGLFVDFPPLGNKFDSNTYAQAWSFVDVYKDIGITGPGGISLIEQHFIQEGDVPGVPEPATMLLFSTALLGLGFMRRKKS